MSDYKSSKEAFVSGTTGSSIGHVNMISLVALVSIALHSALRSRLPSSKQVNFPAEFLILAIPLLLSVTLFANSPGILSVILLFPTCVLLLIPPRESGTPLPMASLSRPNSPTRESSRESSTVGESGRNSAAPTGASSIPLLPALTIYRAHMLLLTSLCILAVDFPVFPRALAKCETFGVSVMDLGVGSFVFSQGLVSAIPIIKNPAYLTAPMLPKVSTVLRKSLPILVLGLLRTISVKGTEYPEHESEYGTHWNFFITLGLLPTLQVLLHPFMLYLPISMLGLIIAFSHQIALSSGGLTSYVLNAPRVTLISQNKEGLISLTGYLAIHLLGMSTGTLLLPPSPSVFRHQRDELLASTSTAHRPQGPNTDVDGRSRRGSVIMPKNKRENDKTAIELVSWAVVWWVLLGVEKAFGMGGGISRRLVNLPYVTYVAAFNTTFLLGYLVLDLIFFSNPMSKSVYSPNSGLKVQTPNTPTRGPVMTVSPPTVGAPKLLEAINKNGLVFFLVANVTTGLVNLTVPTMYVSDGKAMVILVGYTFWMCVAAWLFRGRRLWRF
ncbi:GWT1-domain-containing protein [Cristinia sonorae]|uniref:GPI-anchored wall transfer protein n=1 Tax=Cristinia sonorae TaxID=1940300 RepID=A0A8K0US88_9AGAR|nr:GWT1-domain-containing protein [Cristinia sonorae]